MSASLFTCTERRGNSLDSDSNVDFVAIVMAIVVVVVAAVIIVSIVTFDLHSWRSVFSPFSFQFNIYLRLVAVVVVVLLLYSFYYLMIVIVVLLVVGVLVGFLFIARFVFCSCTCCWLGNGNECFFVSFFFLSCGPKNGQFG